MLPMAVQSRGAQSRRAGREPGWLLMTTLLVLALLASASLVFTDRVELLRLAVVLSLWAAVMAAFVTVVYRRQSEVAQARSRDMKLVYDLQLDREISARREYELSVESELRRRLSQEARAGAADEMSALRAELASLRSQLEVLLGADLSHRPALAGERATGERIAFAGPTVSMSMPSAPDRVQSSRVTGVAEPYAVYDEEPLAESPIIDVPEEPLTPDAPPTPSPAARVAARIPDPDDLVVPPELNPGEWAEPPAPGPDEFVAPWAPGPDELLAPGPDERVVLLTLRSEEQAAPAPQAAGSGGRPAPLDAGRDANAPAGGLPAEPGAAHDPAPGRHWGAAGAGDAGRHRGSPEPEPAGVEAHQPRESDEPAGQHASGQSLSELLSRLEVSGQARGGRRRRRED